MEMSGSEFSLLYSIYSLPNMIVPLIGGKTVDMPKLLLYNRVFELKTFCLQNISKSNRFLIFNIILGYLMDKVIGIRLGAIVFAAVLASGK